MRCRYGGVDPLRVLLSAEERWQLLNRLDVDKPNAQPAGHYYKRRVHLPRVWRLGAARRMCGDTNLTAADKGLGRLPRPKTHFAQSLDCAVRLARGLAASRASASGDAGGSTSGDASGGGARPGVWRLHVASDAPGLTAMLERLPGLEGQVVGCLHPHCYEHSNAGAQHSQRAKSRSNDSLQVGGAIWGMRLQPIHMGLQPILNMVAASKGVGLQPLTHGHGVAGGDRSVGARRG